MATWSRIHIQNLSHCLSRTCGDTDSVGTPWAHRGMQSSPTSRRVPRILRPHTHACAGPLGHSRTQAGLKFSAPGTVTEQLALKPGGQSHLHTCLPHFSPPSLSPLTPGAYPGWSLAGDESVPYNGPWSLFGCVPSMEQALGECVLVTEIPSLPSQVSNSGEDGQTHTEGGLTHRGRAARAFGAHRLGFKPQLLGTVLCGSGQRLPLWEPQRPHVQGGDAVLGVQLR